MGAKYCEQRVCMSVRSYISIITRPDFTKFFSAHVARGRSSMLFWRLCRTLCTSDFVIDVMFSRNRHCVVWGLRPRMSVSGRQRRDGRRLSTSALSLSGWLPLTGWHPSAVSLAVTTEFGCRGEQESITKLLYLRPQNLIIVFFYCESVISWLLISLLLLAFNFYSSFYHVWLRFVKKCMMMMNSALRTGGGRNLLSSIALFAPCILFVMCQNAISPFPRLTDSSDAL